MDNFKYEFLQIIKNITIENCIMILVFAEQIKDEALELRAIKLMNSNKNELALLRFEQLFKKKPHLISKLKKKIKRIKCFLKTFSFMKICSKFS